jgi:MFS family permease
MDSRHMDAKPQPATPPRLPLLLAVFLIALSVLAFEVALSRAFSVLLRFHFVFLAISLATSGLGLGGLADYLTDGWFRRTLSLGAHLSLRACLLAILYPLSIYLLFATPLAAHLTSVWVVSGICILPFFVAGTLLSRVFAERSESGGTLYFADLIGAALGSFLVIGALQLMGATNVPFACGLAAALAALVLSFGSGVGGVTDPDRSRSVTPPTQSLNLRPQLPRPPASPECPHGSGTSVCRRSTR